jgi:transposase
MNLLLKPTKEVWKSFKFNPGIHPPGLAKYDGTSKVLWKESIENQANIQKFIICGDPNVKTFWELMDFSGNCYRLGFNESGKIRALRRILAGLQSKRDTADNENDKSVFDTQMERVRRSIKNTVDTMIGFVTSWMSEFDIAILPRMNVKSMLERGGISHASKGILATMSHCRAYDTLQFKMTKLGHTLVKVGEAYSTQRCCLCGSKSPPGLSRVFKCTNPKCRSIMRRDGNAIRGILHQAIAKASKFVKLFSTNTNITGQSTELQVNSLFQSCKYLFVFQLSIDFTISQKFIRNYIKCKRANVSFYSLFG